MSKIVITRGFSSIAKHRKYTIYLDEKPVGEVANGKIVDIDVLSGDHILKIGTDTKKNCSNSLSFSLGNDEICYFNVEFLKSAVLYYYLNAFSILFMALGASLWFISSRNSFKYGLDQKML